MNFKMFTMRRLEWIILELMDNDVGCQCNLDSIEDVFVILGDHKWEKQVFKDALLKYLKQSDQVTAFGVRVGKDQPRSVPAISLASTGTRDYLHFTETECEKLLDEGLANSFNLKELRIVGHYPEKTKYSITKNIAGAIRRSPALQDIHLSNIDLTLGSLLEATEAIKASPTIRRVALINMGIRSLSGFIGFPRLEKLDLSSNEIRLKSE